MQTIRYRRYCNPTAHSSNAVSPSTSPTTTTRCYPSTSPTTTTRSCPSTSSTTTTRARIALHLPSHHPPSSAVQSCSAAHLSDVQINSSIKLSMTKYQAATIQARDCSAADVYPSRNLYYHHRPVHKSTSDRGCSFTSSLSRFPSIHPSIQPASSVSLAQKSKQRFKIPLHAQGETRTASPPPAHHHHRQSHLIPSQLSQPTQGSCE